MLEGWLGGIVFWVLYLESQKATALLPSSLGMLVYREFTSSVHRIVPSGRGSLSSFRIVKKCPVSLM